MEDLVKSLEGSFHVTKEANSTACPHPRYAQYKQRSSNSDQESRRQCLLEKQKSNRLDYMNLVRKLADEDWTEDGEEEKKEDKKEEEREDEKEEESMEVEANLRKPGCNYKNQLMLSEWLVEVPHDFQTEWLTVLCPMGRRCLVVAAWGVTKVYNKSGHCVNAFKTALPGGNGRSKTKGGTILDCLYSEVNRTYYVLDLMCWNGHPVYDSETEFRFYWLHEKFKEEPTTQEISKFNSYKFVPLPSFACVESSVKGAVEGAAFEIDGLLFYHKRSHYTFGSTPLVVWLKPYMVKEILGIDVPAHQLKERPALYTNYADHMKLVEEGKKKKYKPRKGKKLQNVEMKDAEPEVIEIL